MCGPVPLYVTTHLIFRLIHKSEHISPTLVLLTKPCTSHMPWSKQICNRIPVSPVYQPANGQTNSTPGHQSPSASPRKVHSSCTTHYAGMSDITRYLARRQLFNSGLSKFDYHPENYWSWRTSFTGAREGLRLTHSKELDLLVNG